MIKIYNAMLYLSNPKLYTSPYNHNIIEVSKILDNYTLKFKIKFLKNFKTLKIEEMTKEKKEQHKDSANRLYYVNKNTIKLLSTSNETTKNHELFHSASGEGIETRFTGKN